MYERIKSFCRRLVTFKSELSELLQEAEEILELVAASQPELIPQSDNEMLVGKLKDIQRDTALLQVRKANVLQSMDTLTIQPYELCRAPFCEVIPGGVKISLEDEYPPKYSVYDKVFIKDGIMTNLAYAEARNRWFSQIKSAMESYRGERIIPAIVYLKFFVPRRCDAGNFIVKFIIDALMYYGPIANDDNLENLSAVIQEALIDKESPRTEIFVIRNKGQLHSLLESN